VDVGIKYITPVAFSLHTKSLVTFILE